MSTEQAQLSRQELQEGYALRESEQRLKTAIENLSDGLIIADMDGHLLYWNESALEMHGFANSKDVPFTLPEFATTFGLSDIGGAVLDAGQWPLPRVIRGEKLRNVEVRLSRLDADWMRILNYGGCVIQESNGRPLAFLTITDITEQKRVEEEWQLLTSIVESSEDAIIGEDLDGKVLSWNGGATRLYGYSHSEAVGQSIWIDETTTTEARRKGERVHYNETERLTKEGKPISVSLTISPIRDRTDKLIGSSTIARDITEHNRIEEVRKRSDVQSRRLFETAKYGILILDETSGRIVDSNPFLSELLGYSKEELCGKELWEIGALEDIAAAKIAFAHLKEQGYIQYQDLPLVNRDGHHKQVEFVSNRYLAGEGLAIQCNIRDITERKLAEKTMKEANERLERTLVELKARTADLAAMTQQLWQASKLSTMGELAASIAHELNNPLTTISLSIEGLASEFSADEQKSHLFEVMLGEVDRMGKLVGNLLRFSRHSHQEISTLDLREEIEGSLELVEYHLRANRIEVVREFDENLPTIHGDCQQVRQVFLNLLTNASDAMPEGGTLTVRVRRQEAEGAVTGVAIDFSDSGPGIPPDILERIWQPFFTTKPEGKGTGLGLAISRRAIETHHGTIAIDSQVGKGTTVTIFLPVATVPILEFSSGAN